MSSAFTRMRHRLEAKAPEKRRSRYTVPEKKAPKSPPRTRLQEAQLRAATGGKHAVRELICAENGVKNTGRQWNRLHKKLRREDRNVTRRESGENS